VDELDRVRRTLGSADPRGFFLPGTFRSPNFNLLEGNPSDYLHTNYLGWSLIALAIGGAIMSKKRWFRPIKGRRVFVIAGLTAAILAMGPVMVWDGQPLGIGALANTLPLPYAAIEPIPGFNSLSLLFRLGILTSLALSVLADGARVPWLLLVVLEFCFFAPTHDFPDHTPVSQTGALSILGTQSPQQMSNGPEGVMNLPPSASSSYLFEQSVHGHPIVGSLNASINPKGVGLLNTARELHKGLTDYQSFVKKAKDSRIRWVVIHEAVLMDDRYIAPTLAIKRNATLIIEQDEFAIFAIY
jgi:hypothetical protein